MKTEVIVIDRKALRPQDGEAGYPELDRQLAGAARILRDGGLVAFPTETVYGLGADGLNAGAAEKIYAAKGRPSDNPLILHISSREEIFPLVEEVPETAGILMEKFWPGPLTMIFRKSGIVPYQATGGLDTVAVRMPDDIVANRLIALAGVPVAAPSANLSGRPSPTTAAHVLQDMDGRIEMILDGGPVGIGVESTIVDVTGRIPVLLRPGAITLEMLSEAVGQVDIDPAILGPLTADVRPKAPGMKYRHYAPKAELVLVEERGGAASGTAGSGQAPVGNAVISRIRELAGEKIKEGHVVGIICTDETRDCYPEGIVRSVGRRGDEETIARSLFAVLRQFDDIGAEYIYSESFARDNLGRAIMNRLTKAAGYHIIYCGDQERRS